MANECDVSKIVSTFILNTCGLPPRQIIRDIYAAICCVSIAAGADDQKDDLGHDGHDCEFIPLTTGSVAEFYIEPMLPHIGDIDVMFYWNTHLAIPRGHPPPTQLPAEFHTYVQVHEIIDSHLPGYVYLRLRYLLTQCIDDDGKYNYTEYEEELYFSNRHYGVDLSDMHGPALFTAFNQTSSYPVDIVRCIRCLSWPPQAAYWPTRHRNYGWPDSATLGRVVSNGCDVVGVAHRQCRQHEWMGNHQWRLSFSRAEIVLINSWMPVQQIAYHLLRYFIKTERLTDCAGDSGAGTLSNYHIKTLMLWACELKPRSWWNENLNLVRICVELLQTLSVWLTDTRCPHYFINNSNLLDYSFNVRSVARKLISMNIEYLSSWLIHNYIRQCAQLCPIYISRLFLDVSDIVKLENVVSQIIRWRVDYSLYDMWKGVNYAEDLIAASLPNSSLTVRECVRWINELSKIDQRFSIYFSAFILLHIACKISRNGLKNEMLDILAILLGMNVFSLRRTDLNTSELVELLQKFAVERLTVYRQSVAPDLGFLLTIVPTDFEAMYAYKRGQYQWCLQLSTQNVYTLLCGVNVPIVRTLPEFIQLLDDDIVSLTALTLIVNSECRDHYSGSSISQVILSLYLMTQCQLKLRHSVTSLAHTLHYIKFARIRHPRVCTLDHLTLKLIERKIFLTISH